jgi:phytoene synthase
MGTTNEDDVFKAMSPTLYYSCRFFTAEIRQDINKLFGFIKVIADYVDFVPARPDHIAHIEYLWSLVRDNPGEALSFNNAQDPDELVIRDMAYLQNKYHFDPAWTESYFASMHMILYGRRYETIEETLQYMAGSSEIIGRYIAQMLHLHPDAHYFAKLQARAFHYIELILNAPEDAALGRTYFPMDELHTFGLADLSNKTVYKFPVAYKDFIGMQLARYKEWQGEAEQGFRFMRRPDRIPVRTAIDVYKQIADHIAANPLMVYDKKPAPTRWQVYKHGIIRTYYC